MTTTVSDIRKLLALYTPEKEIVFLDTRGLELEFQSITEIDDDTLVIQFRKNTHI